MKNLSVQAKVYILGTILATIALIAWMLFNLHWMNAGLYLLAALGAVAQTLKVEGPNDKTNYNIAWFVYGFTFIALGPTSAIFVVFMAHLAEWAWHKYPWFIQSFNIGAHVIPLFLAGLVYEAIDGGSLAPTTGETVAILLANLVVVFGNHFMVGVVIKQARGQSFAESGVFGFYTLFLDFTLLSMGSATALIWSFNPAASLLNILPIYLLYNSIRVPALARQLEKMKATRSQMELETSGD